MTTSAALTFPESGVSFSACCTGGQRSGGTPAFEKRCPVSRSPSVCFRTRNLNPPVPPQQQNHTGREKSHLAKQPPPSRFPWDFSMLQKRFILPKSAFLWLPQPSNNGGWSNPVWFANLNGLLGWKQKLFLPLPYYYSWLGEKRPCIRARYWILEGISHQLLSLYSLQWRAAFNPEKTDFYTKFCEKISHG